MSDTFSRIGQFAANLLSGGTLEIVLLIVLIVVGLILLLVALWVLWKLLVLLGKGTLFLFRSGREVAGKRSAERKAERLAAPPPVTTGWGSSARIGLRKALAEARRHAEPDALWIVVVAGSGGSDLCRSLGLVPPGVGEIGIAAGGDTILIDAAGAKDSRLRTLGAALPWRRPADAIAVVAEGGVVPPDAIARATKFSRAAGMRMSLHLALGAASPVPAFRIVDSGNRDGDDLCEQLAQDCVRRWLGGGSREGLEDLSRAQAPDLAATINRTLALAPASTVDFSSLSLGGAGLRHAVAQTVERTRPADLPGLAMWLGAGALAIGLALAGVAAISTIEKAADLRATVATAGREGATPWLTADIQPLPAGSRVRRVAGVSAHLAEFSEASLVAPLATLVPGHGAPARLGGVLLDSYVLRPLAASLDRRARRHLAPSEDPAAWLADAARVDEWLAAWEGLDDDPREVDLRRLLADAFGGNPAVWPEGLDIALAETNVPPPAPDRGGLDVDDLAETARRNFIATMQRWGGSVYTNGPVAGAARRAVDRSASWREQHRALSDLRSALQDPGQTWLTAAEDRPDYGFELRMLGRALAMSVLGEATALEAKAAVSRIRIDAREAAEYFILPEVGPLMSRSGSGAQGGGGGPALTLTPRAEGWLSFLDRVDGAGFGDLPEEPASLIAGPVTVDPAAVAATLRKLRDFDRFGSQLPTDIPPAVAEDLLLEVGRELIVGVVASVERALRPAVAAVQSGDDAARLLRVRPALEGLEEVETWLRQRGADGEGDRVLEARTRVAENVLAAGEQALAEEDPLGLFLDPAADANALVRRFERGLVRLRRLHEQFAAPYVDAGAVGGRAAAFRWRDIGRDIDAFDRGDGDSALSGMDGLARAYADDPASACEAPRPVAAAGRGDYVASALGRFRAQVDRACAGLARRGAADAYEALRDYFVRNAVWMWPFARDANAPEMPGSTMGEFVSRLHEARDALKATDGVLTPLFREQAAFWGWADDARAVLRFRVEWRVRPEEERLAAHVIAFDFDGVERDEAGVYTWRYGAPAALRVRLAKNSPYRFVAPADAEGLEMRIAGDGNGGMLRVFDGLSGGAWQVEAEVLGEGGARRSLRVTARVSDDAGQPMRLPRFDAYPSEVQGAAAELR